eukprot:75384-Prorocentrum_minimum.AAC.2
MVPRRKYPRVRAVRPVTSTRTSTDPSTKYAPPPSTTAPIHRRTGPGRPIPTPNATPPPRRASAPRALARVGASQAPPPPPRASRRSRARKE